MNNEFITKQCERCGAEVKVPREYPEVDYLLKWYQVTCENNCSKTHTFNYVRMKWLK
ncbi:MAG: hypothetical protein IH964_03020 [Candidatus Dadabacteria bacterium]|nr:hypothetical protein [Candidatus Dadabacteria bacterium]